MSSVELLEQSPVRSALATSCQPQLRRLSVVEDEERVEVSGRVSSYYMKSIALETVKAAAEGRPILLMVEVES